MEKKKRSLFRRQKLLLALLQAFGERVPGIDFQKYLFLFTELHEKDKSYEFIPYKHGCFSFQSYADRRYFIDVGIIKNSEDWEILDHSINYLSGISTSDRREIISFVQKFKITKGNDLIRYVYRNYPYYAINSEIAAEHMQPEELEAIESTKSKDEDYKFFTIGYEGQSFENYLNRLITNNVKTLCDVRNNPLSRKYGFSKSTLSNTLNSLGIEYIHIPELGIVSEKRQALKTADDYEELFNDYEKTTLIQNSEYLRELFNIFSNKKRVAITCFEAEPDMCHRGRVAKVLSSHPSWNHEIMHI